MADRTLQPGFAFLPAAAALTAVAVLTGGLAHWAVPSLVHDEQAASPAVWPMVTLGWVTAMVSLLPVALLGPLGVMATVVGWFVGTAARVVITLGLAWWLVRQMDLSSEAATWALMIVYLPLLFTEAGLVGRYLWMKDSLPRGRTVPPAEGALA